MPSNYEMSFEVKTKQRKNGRRCFKKSPRGYKQSTCLSNDLEPVALEREYVKLPIRAKKNTGVLLKCSLFPVSAASRIMPVTYHDKKLANVRHPGDVCF